MRRTSRPVWRLFDGGLTRNAAGMALRHHIARAAIFWLRSYVKVVECLIFQCNLSEAGRGHRRYVCRFLYDVVLQRSFCRVAGGM